MALAGGSLSAEESGSVPDQVRAESYALTGAAPGTKDQPMFADFMKTLAGPCAVKDGDAVLACVSGGLDSMVLLELLRQAAVPMRLKIGVVHVDHGLRKEASRKDAQFVLARCLEIGVQCFLKELHMDPGLPNLEEEARRRRYDAVIACMRNEGYAFAATGHTLNDQAETVLYRVARGTGIRGLAGMSFSRPDGIIRPLLQFSRKQLEFFARERAVGFVKDLTNDDPRHSRNLIRHSLIPVLEKINPRAVEAVARLAEIAREESAFLEEAAARLEEQARIFDWGMVRGYSADALKKVEDTVARRFIINTVADMAGDPRGIDQLQVDAVLGVLRGSAAAHTVKRQVRVILDGQALIFRQASRGPFYRVRANAPGIVQLKEINLGLNVPGSLLAGRPCEIRSYLPGDRCGGVRVAEILARMGVMNALRPFWPVLVAGDDVLAVASRKHGYNPDDMTGLEQHGI